MKKLISITIVALLAFSCKEEIEPNYGQFSYQIKNISDRNIDVKYVSPYYDYKDTIALSLKPNDSIICVIKLNYEIITSTGETPYISIWVSNTTKSEDWSNFVKKFIFINEHKKIDLK
jgi:hypothetical protein